MDQLSHDSESAAHCGLKSISLGRGSSGEAVHNVDRRGERRVAQPFAGVSRLSYCSGLKSGGASEPSPKKNFCISSSRNLRAFGSIVVSRYSLISIV